MPEADRSVSPLEAEPGPRGLWLGVLAYRWAAFAWMSVQAFVVREDFRTPGPWVAIGLTGVWVILLTVTDWWERPIARLTDLALAAGLIVVSGLVLEKGQIVQSYAPFFATAYPVAAAMTIGAEDGGGAGLLAGAMLSVALVASRVANGISLSALTTGEWLALGNGAVYYLSAGGAVGLVSRMLRRSAIELRTANEEATRQRERAARLAEHHAMAREIHDSVLQALAMVNKRGAELAERPSVPGTEVRALVEMAREQARSLRALIQQEPGEAPPDMVPLRTVLQASAFGVHAVSVDIVAAGEIYFPAACVANLSAAVHQALENAAQHARASRVSVFAERDDDAVTVTIRDDGVGFEYDEDRLRREGKMGVLASMRGRVEEIGGRVRITSAPGAGTEVEFRVPVR